MRRLEFQVKKKHTGIVPQCAKDHVAAVRHARIAAGVGTDDGRFHERRVEHDPPRKVGEKIAGRAIRAALRSNHVFDPRVTRGRRK